MTASVSIYMVRTDSMDIDPYRWSSLYTVTYAEQQTGAQYIVWVDIHTVGPHYMYWHDSHM